MPTFANAFVTGASSGIGRALALDLASRGTRVVAAARREPDLVSLRNDPRASGGRIDVCVLDVSDADKAARAVRDWDARTGGLDLVVANAGISDNCPARELDPERVERMLRVNVNGAFATLAAAIGPMVRRGRGTLAGVSSLAGMRGLPWGGVYSATKAALSTFLETIRVELGPLGVRVVDIRPGFVDTAMTKNHRFPGPRDRFVVGIEQATAIIAGALERGDAICAFPFAQAAAMRFAESLPGPLWRSLGAPIARKMAGGMVSGNGG